MQVTTSSRVETAFAASDPNDQGYAIKAANLTRFIEAGAKLTLSDKRSVVHAVLLHSVLDGCRFAIEWGLSPHQLLNLLCTSTCFKRHHGLRANLSAAITETLPYKDQVTERLHQLTYGLGEEKVKAPRSKVAKQLHQDLIEYYGGQLQARNWEGLKAGRSPLRPVYDYLWYAYNAVFNESIPNSTVVNMAWKALASKPVARQAAAKVFLSETSSSSHSTDARNFDEYMRRLNAPPDCNEGLFAVSDRRAALGELLQHTRQGIALKLASNKPMSHSDAVKIFDALGIAQNAELADFALSRAVSGRRDDLLVRARASFAQKRILALLEESLEKRGIVEAILQPEGSTYRIESSAQIAQPFELIGRRELPQISSPYLASDSEGDLLMTDIVDEEGAAYPPRLHFWSGGHIVLSESGGRDGQLHDGIAAYDTVSDNFYDHAVFYADGHRRESPRTSARFRFFRSEGGIYFFTIPYHENSFEALIRFENGTFRPVIGADRFSHLRFCRIAGSVYFTAQDVSGNCTVCALRGGALDSIINLGKGRVVAHSSASMRFLVREGERMYICTPHTRRFISDVDKCNYAQFFGERFYFLGVTEAGSFHFLEGQRPVPAISYSATEDLEGRIAFCSDTEVQIVNFETGKISTIQTEGFARIAYTNLPELYYIRDLEQECELFLVTDKLESIGTYRSLNDSGQSETNDGVFALHFVAPRDVRLIGPFGEDSYCYSIGGKRYRFGDSPDRKGWIIRDENNVCVLSGEGYSADIQFSKDEFAVISRNENSANWYRFRIKGSPAGQVIQPTEYETYLLYLLDTVENLDPARLKEWARTAEPNNCKPLSSGATDLLVDSLTDDPLEFAKLCASEPTPPSCAELKHLLLCLFPDLAARKREQDRRSVGDCGSPERETYFPAGDPRSKEGALVGTLGHEYRGFLALQAYESFSAGVWTSLNIPVASLAQEGSLQVSLRNPSYSSEVSGLYVLNGTIQVNGGASVKASPGGGGQILCAPGQYVVDSYSIGIPRTFHPTPLLSADYESFACELRAKYGDGIADPIPGIPAEAIQFAKSLVELEPHERVIAAEQWVRRVCWYDYDNREIFSLKDTMDMAQRMRAIRARMTELVLKHGPGETQGKLYGVVCSEAQLLLAGILRHAGITCWPVAGYVPHKLHVYEKKSHLVLAVPWPSPDGKSMHVIQVDATPTGSSAESAFSRQADEPLLHLSAGSPERELTDESRSDKSVRKSERKPSSVSYQSMHFSEDAITRVAETLLALGEMPDRWVFGVEWDKRFLKLLPPSDQSLVYRVRNLTPVFMAALSLPGMRNDLTEDDVKRYMQRALELAGERYSELRSF